MTLTGSMNADIPIGQIACIPYGTVFTGSVNLNGGTLVICGTARMTSLNMNSGRVVVIGDANFQGISIHGVFENYGNTTTSYDCIVNPNCELINYGTLIIRGSLSSNGRTSNYSILSIDRELVQNSSDIFTNECSITLGNALHVNGTFINRGTITGTATAFINGGSQLVADDGSLLSIKSIYINGHIDGGSAGYSSISVSENTTINGGAMINGLLDICDKNGIEVNSGVLAKTVTTDCRCITDGYGGTATFVWTDSLGKIVGTGKQISVTPASTSVYTVTVTDVNGNKISDQITVFVNNCK
jgi:hypothetical protein